MSRHFISLLALAALLAAGCHGPGHPDLPVDLEGATNTAAYFGPECMQFPNASPPCPYFSPPEAFADGPAAAAASGCPCSACRPSKPPLTEENMADYQ